MSIMGEAVLSACVEMLFKKLATPELLQFARQKQIRADLKKWEKLLIMIHAVLDDAEEKQMTNGLVKIWLGDLKNLAYDVEDILDDFATEVLRAKLLLQLQQASKSKVHKLIPRYCASLNSPSIKFNIKMRSKIRDITLRLQDISTQKNNLDLKENLVRRSIKGSERLPTTSLVNEAYVCGRETDKGSVLELLLRDEGADDCASVLPILGMGGVGKTTLAQLVYNDVRVENHFDLKAWACVSEDFDVVRITKTILHSVDSRADDANDLNLLQVKLKEKLSGKKFLLILDDIWNDNYDDWTVLRCPFEVGLPGSKVIVTTRSQSVSTMMGTFPAYSLKELSNDACLSVFTQHSLGRNDFCMHQYLKDIGEMIVKKCNGLPLAAKTLGGLLRGKYDPEDWKDVLNSNMWDLPGGIIPALRLSYHYLPPHLKRCFAYCSIFPKGYEFQEEEIVLLWMAEGFLQHEIGEQQMEVLGHKYFRELQSRSFFQRSSRDVTWFVMHDLINDLAQWAAEDSCLRIENALERDNQEKVYKSLRHLSYVGGKYDGIKKFEALKDIKQLRTFLPLKSLHPGWCYLTCNVVFNMLPKLQRLRVLSLHGYRVVELPKAIGNLKQLRYLDLSSTAIEVLPESISKLYNLQTLKLENCRRLKKLCTHIGNLINLQHLNNSNVHSLEEMPLSIGKLTGLQTLPNFVVGCGTGSGLGALKSLMHIRQTLQISRLKNVDSVKDAKDANLHSMRNLNALLLDWTRSIGDSNKAEMETLVLNMLKPHQNLKELSVRGYGGTKFPTWLGDFSFSSLVILRFEDCGKCTSLPSVGQLPLLKELVIKGMTGLKILGPEFYGNGFSEPFPSLEALCFEDMQEWQNWIPHGPRREVIGFPRLQVLSIVRCSELLGNLPEHLPSLKRLVIKKCEQLLVSVPCLPSLCKLEIDACKEVVWRRNVDLSSLNTVVLSDIASQMFLSEQLLQVLPKLEELKIVGCKELTSFWLSGIGLQQDTRFLRRLVIE